jgi:KDO2-lipid IV(A) lauroyltransferase
MSGSDGAAHEPLPLRHRLEFAGFRLARGVLRIVPESVAFALGEALGWLSGVVVRLRRDVVDANLARAFPDRPAAWRDRVAVASYRHLVREAVATFRLSGAPAERIRTLAPIQGLAPFLEELEAGRGAVIVTAHLGNWELGSATLAAHGVPVDAVVHRQRNRLFDQELRETRARLGTGVILRDQAPRLVLRSLRAGRAVGLVADQNVSHSGVFVDFFGVPASTARGPAVFALRTGAPIWVGWVVASEGEGPRYRAELRRLEVAYGEGGEDDVRHIAQAINHALEEVIRAYPEQYFWHHRRWKTRPPPE